MMENHGPFSDTGVAGGRSCNLIFDKITGVSASLQQRGRDAMLECATVFSVPQK